MTNTAVQPMTIDGPTVAKRVGISYPMWRKLCRQDMAPKPIRLGRLCRWSVTIIDRWIEAGCPSRKEFEASVPRMTA